MLKNDNSKFQSTSEAQKDLPTNVTYTKNEKIKLILLLALLNKARFYNQSTESIHGSIVSEESENVCCISVDTEFFV